MRRWTASYVFRYRPIISWERRRNELLDWVENHVELVSFRDERTEVGFALVEGVRIRISRQLTIVEDSAAVPGSVESLWPMLDAVIETLAPRDIVLDRAAIAWSNELQGKDYAEATRSFAERVTGIHSALPSGLRPTDVAPLVDFMNSRFHVQAEYGVVNPSELRARINDPDAGKISGRPEASLPISDFNQLAPLLIFVDTVMHLREAEPLKDQNAIQRSIDEFQAAAGEVAEAVASMALPQRENAK